ncbi:uncharacterized protein LOC122513158 [Polistes fuscatus]|uniref:uncharacterized protein LOC122513158 n=1 Tax=Polistes fuscatus TaxID=30207 RepID=UPI001CA8AFEE|nr:uncharacterized protein LOC122513158 [Polistes fuscatus]
MNTENSLHEVKGISYYQNKVLSMINFSGSKKKGFFYTWLNKFEYAADMFEVPDDKMKELFLTLVHEDFHAQIQLCFPYVNFSKISYEQIIEYYFHYFKSPNEDPHRRRFLCRNQYEQESIKNYANSLRKICNKYNFQQPVEKKLYTKFINGIHDEEIRTNLKKFPCLSFGEIVYFASIVKEKCVKEIITYLTEALSMITIYHSEKSSTFYYWINKFEYVVDKIKVPRDKIIQFFNKMVDDNVHTSVKETYPSVDFSKLSYEEIINHYLRFFASPYVNNVYRIRLMYRQQFEQESIESYADNLRNICNKCDDNNQLKEKLREMFIYGIRDDDVKHHLSNTPNLSFDETVMKAIEFVNVKEITYYIDHALSMINIYNSKKEGQFYAWLNEFEYVADIIGVPNMKMIQFFYKMVNNDIHTNVQKAFPSVNFFQLTYEEIINHYFIYFAPSYKSNLYKIRFSYEKLCDQFIKGIYDDDIRNYLSTISDLSFDEMVVEAVQFEKCNLIPYYINRAFSMIRSYNPEKEGDFCSWLNKFEYVADCIRVPHMKMVKFFYKMVDYDVHLSVKEAFPFIDIFELSYEEVINDYYFYFTLSTETYLYRSRFVCREQYDNETIKQFADSLWEIYKKCNYIAMAVELENANEIIHYLILEIPMIHIYDPAKEETLTRFQQFSIFKFNPMNMDLLKWLNWFEYMAVLEKFKDDEMVSTLLKCLESVVLMKIQESVAPTDMVDLSYDKLLSLLEELYSSLRGSDAADYRFLTRFQYPYENIPQFVLALRKLSSKCSPALRSHHEIKLHFIRGLKNEITRKILEKNVNISFDFFPVALLESLSAVAAFASLDVSSVATAMALVTAA